MLHHSSPNPPVELVTLETVVELPHDVEGLLGRLDQLVQLRVQLGVAVQGLGDPAHALHVGVDRHHGTLGFLSNSKCQ